MANAMLLAAPCLLLGLLAQTSIYAFPLPDLIILGYLLSVVLGKTDTFDRVSPPVDPTQIDIEERLHRGLRTVLHSDYGLFLTVYCLLGAFLGCGTLGIAVSVGWAYLGDIINVGLTFNTWVQWLYLWHLIGVVLLLVLAGGYGIWVWLREFKRLPSYLRYYAEGSEGSLRVSPPRPVGMTLVPVGVLLLAGAWLEFLSEWAFAVLWPLTAIGVVGCVYLTLRRESTRINNENHAIIGAFLIHGLGILAIGKSNAVFRIITHNQLPLREIFHSPLPMIVASNFTSFGN
jgi:hypothetical protein